MGLVKEFKEFAMKGNVVDLAVGIIIGGAFGKIVSSLVGDVIMPMVSALTGGTSFTDKFLWLGKGPKPDTLAVAKEMGGAYLGWGSFLQNVLDFVIVAAAIFAMIKVMNSLKKKEEAAPSVTPEDVVLLREIRDSLAKR
ncbi:large conductance mechanosensitive channel protein MscL [Bythopirellula goksoeyrii]|uniref:Large-conductance mechanosensitive channel n=1 Tax=Bythopirellula goksoeyrii TaxID=1400387 RepID=A0A5B9QMQ9_9BACT|nr:large conductance mechanosensitive channel protein MscL [Bythopirellula goksoeyrii]QEG35283.1 Large-conductance mechanosensitive channel [Bythopirellula goksoeyrii]